MKLIFTVCMLTAVLTAGAQTQQGIMNVAQQAPNDVQLQERLIALALENPAYKQADALAAGAGYSVKASKSAWLNTFVISGNVNEFVVNNTTINGIPASTLFPKYNVGVNVPMGIFARQDKKIAVENHKSLLAQKELQERELKKRVLILYENYKEKKELVELQKQITEGQYRAYQQVQASYASAEVAQLEDVNKNYEQWIDQRSKQRTKERDLRIAELELEEIIGMPVAAALSPEFKKLRP